MTDRHHPNRRQLIKSTLALSMAPLITGISSSSSVQAAAPKLGPSFPMVLRFQLGEFEITTILDTIAKRDGPYPIIGKNASEEEVHKLMRENLMPETSWQPGFTPTLINTGRELILFDTGNGANGSVKRPNGGLLLSQLEAAGYKPEDIDIVIITHGHGDHIGGLLEEGKPAFPNARYIFGEREYDFWTTSEMNTDRLKGGAAKFNKMTEPLREKITFISPGMQVLSGIEPIEAFGHTPGHLAFHIESNGQKLLLWADCAHHHVASLARPGWHIHFDVEKEEGVKTRKKIFDMAATDKLPVIGFHMPFPSLGFVEKRQDEGYRWVQHSYQLK